MTPRETRLKKLTFRAWHRGFREMDLIMGTFADQHLANLDEAGVDAFEALLETPDQDVYAWLTGVIETPEAMRTETFALLKSFQYFARTLWANGASA
jgi:antitoxin CptB